MCIGGKEVGATLKVFLILGVVTVETTLSYPSERVASQPTMTSVIEGETGIDREP